MIYLAVVAGIFALDFLIKRHIEKNYVGRVRHKKLHNKIYIEKYYNNGAALNFLAKRPRLLTLLHTLAMIFMCVMFYMYLRLSGKELAKTGLSFLIGGGLSNLFDRYTKGHVVDYVGFCFGPKWFQRIVYNISDFFVFIGAALMVIGHY